MPLHPNLETKLDKEYEPSTRIDAEFRGKDLTIVTDKAGRAVTLFIGKRNPDGSIAGERFVRRLVLGPDGKTILKSHWENKGKVSRT